MTETPRDCRTLALPAPSSLRGGDASTVPGGGFLKNRRPRTMLQPRIGLDPEVARIIEKDPDNAPFMQGSMLLLRRLGAASVTERRIMQPLPSGAQLGDTSP